MPGTADQEPQWRGFEAQAPLERPRPGRRDVLDPNRGPPRARHRGRLGRVPPLQVARLRAWVVRAEDVGDRLLVAPDLLLHVVLDLSPYRYGTYRGGFAGEVHVGCWGGRTFAACRLLTARLFAKTMDPAFDLGLIRLQKAARASAEIAFRAQAELTAMSAHADKLADAAPSALPTAGADFRPRRPGRPCGGPATLLKAQIALTGAAARWSRAFLLRVS